MELLSPVVAAPMAGYSDRVFRFLAYEAGCGVAFTGMLNARAVLAGACDPREILVEGGPVAVQIFGSDPGWMAAAAERLVELGAALVDVNMGCPAPDVVKTGAGVALMRDPERAAAVVRAVAARVPVPVTVKMRRGWAPGFPEAVEVARAVEAAGAAAVTVHGRYGTEFFRGRADWEIIRRVKEAVRIPVVGNGDVGSPQEAALMMELTGCDAVMIGRGALADPTLLRRTVRYLTRGELEPPPESRVRLEQARRYVRLAALRLGEGEGLACPKRHLLRFLRGFPGAAALRERIAGAVSLAELEAILDGLPRGEAAGG
ncbi:MAG: tRNA dihydrouridine synthase DusB [Desulfotomaculales bacterium]